MRARIISPIKEAVGVVGVVWMDCDFPKLPATYDVIEFYSPKGSMEPFHLSLKANKTTLTNVIKADNTISPPDIDHILITGMLDFPAGRLDVKHTSSLNRQGWRRENQENENWPENADNVGFWMMKVRLCQPPLMASWARAVAAKRDEKVFKCNNAILSQGKWIVEPSVFPKSDQTSP